MVLMYYRGGGYIFVQRSSHLLVPIRGMTCSNCERRVVDALRGVPGVLGVAASHGRGEADLDIDPAKPPAQSAVAAAVREAGYDVDALQVQDGRPLPKSDAVAEFAIYGMTCAACVSTIERRLGREPGIASVAVNLGTERASVHYDRAMASPATIEAAVADAGYRAEPLSSGADAQSQVDAQSREARSAWWWFVAAAVPATLVLLLSMVFTDVPGQPWWLLVLATPVQFIAGARYYRGAIAALRQGGANMDTLVALGTTTAYAYSTINLFRGSGDVFYETSALLIAFVLLGKALEISAKTRAGDAIRALMNLAPKRARVMRDGTEAEIDAAAVVLGDIVIVRPGEAFAVDGSVTEGASSVNEAMLTGESVPRAKRPGAAVYAGTLNVDGSLRYLATKVGKETALAGIVRMVDEAQSAKAPVQRFADAVSNVFVPAVIVIALVTFAVWLFALHSTFEFAVMAAVSVVVIACPCALGLATPTAMMVGLGRGAAGGILIRDGAALESANSIDIVLLDKTGTLTEGRPVVVAAVALGGEDLDRAFADIAAVEALSEHPVARAIVEEARRRGAVKIQLADVTLFFAEPGRGARGRVHGTNVIVGSLQFVESYGVKLTAGALDKLPNGATLVIGARDQRAVVAIAVADQVKDGARDAVDRLRMLGAVPTLVTGDNASAAQAAASAAGIDDVRAGVSPSGKADIVRALQRDGHRVAMVGDGINDAPALACADVGIALGSAADVAAQAGSIVLVNNDLGDVPRALRLARATYGKIKGGMFWALAYNVLGIPIAAGVLYPVWHAMLRPEFAGLAMALSSVSVVLNALSLKRTPIG
jgi:Cu+-exporting ATPase